MKRNWLLVLAVCSIGVHAPAQNATLDVAALKQRLEALRIANKLPALSATITQGNQTLVVLNLGVNNAKTQKPISDNSSFQLGSNSKSMTATMIARLVERGLLRWTSTLGDILPSIKMRDEYKNVNLEMLLAHRAGLARDVDQIISGSRENSRNQYAARALAIPRAAQKFEYSNIGYILAAMMAEAVSKKTWSDLMKTEVFVPLGMTGCTTGVGLESKDPFPHDFKNGAPVVLPMDSVNTTVLDGADRVLCPIKDYALYLRAHQTRGRELPNYLKPETWLKLHTDPYGDEYALGWGIRQINPQNLRLSHGGSNTHNFVLAYVFPDRDYSAAIATNIGVDEKFDFTLVSKPMNEGLQILLREVRNR